MIKSFDKVGRIVIPKEMRDKLDFDETSEAKIELVGDKIIISNKKKFDVKEYLKSEIENCSFAEEKLIYLKVLNKIEENE